MLHSDGFPKRVLELIKAAGTMTTADIANAIGLSHKQVRNICATLTKHGEVIGVEGTNYATGRPMRTWSAGTNCRRIALEKVQADSYAVRLEARRRMEMAQAMGGYPGRDVRYQLADDWESPSTGFRGVGIGRDIQTGRPWGVNGPQPEPRGLDSADAV